MIKNLFKFTMLIAFALCFFSCSKDDDKSKEVKTELNQPILNTKDDKDKAKESSANKNEELYQKALKEASILFEFSAVNKKINISIRADKNIKIEGAVPSEITADGTFQEIFIAKPELALLGDVSELKIHDAEILQGIKIVKSQSLNHLDISFSGLKTAEFFDCPSLSSLVLEHNKKLENLNLKALTALANLSVKASPILALASSDALPQDFLANLKKLDCSETKIKKLDFSLFSSLEYLNFSSTRFDSVDLTKNIELKELYCENADLKELDLSKNKKLTHLNCRGNKLSDLALFQNKALKSLDCGKNELNKLFISLNTRLAKLYCDSNLIEELDVSALKEIEEIYCYRNKIEKIILGSSESLKALFCFENNISEENMKTLFNSLKEGDGYNFKTLAVYAEENPNLTYNADKYFDNNFIPNDEMLVSSYSKFWNICFTLYGLEDMGSILDSLIQKNKKF